jgi:hypothetical protein
MIARGAGTDVDVLAKVPAENGDDVRLEAAPATFSVRSDALAETSRKANGPCDRGTDAPRTGSCQWGPDSRNAASRKSRGAGGSGRDLDQRRRGPAKRSQRSPGTRR